jgi:nucleotide-binding universal stress UspA family protein
MSFSRAVPAMDPGSTEAAARAVYWDALKDNERQIQAVDHRIALALEDHDGDVSAMVRAVHDLIEEHFRLGRVRDAIIEQEYARRSGGAGGSARPTSVGRGPEQS